MDKKDILEMIIFEMTEHALTVRRETCQETEQQLYQKAAMLSREKQELLSKMPQEDRQIIESYIETLNMIARHECEYLYVQGAKDCVALLLELGVL